MKKLGLLLVAATLLGGTILTGCSGNDSSETSKEQSRVEKAIADAETLSHDELFAKAAEELGTSGKVKILATTSRGGKDKVKNLFISELQKHNANITDPLGYNTTVDGAIYGTLNTEIQSGSTTGYSGTITQDGYQLQKKGIERGGYLNYVPKTWNDNAASDKTAADPFTLQYNFKTWMYNNKNGDVVIDNVWDVTHSKYKGLIYTMDPNNENVNMDWLIQLTEDTQVAKLKAAFEDTTNSSDLDISAYSAYGEKKYAYAFIDGFIKNAKFYEDDGKAMADLSAAPGSLGWIVYSKILKVTESADISKKNIVVAALGEKNTDGATMGDSCIKGFSGFMYKHYLQVMPNAQYPYATCAFFELISTNAEAYTVWGNDVGDYPSLPTINVDRTKGGVDYELADGTKANVSCLNDPTSTWWINKANAVVETPSFIGANYDNVIDFIDASIASK
jgi:outer membrane murein-binding lipoprotein Lpp